jgi:hypothetical protein
MCVCVCVCVCVCYAHMQARLHACQGLAIGWAGAGLGSGAWGARVHAYAHIVGVSVCGVHAIVHVSSGVFSCVRGRTPACLHACAGVAYVSACQHGCYVACAGVAFRRLGRLDPLVCSISFDIRVPDSLKERLLESSGLTVLQQTAEAQSIWHMFVINSHELQSPAGMAAGVGEGFQGKGQNVQDAVGCGQLVFGWRAKGRWEDKT